MTDADIAFASMAAARSGSVDRSALDFDPRAEALAVFSAHSAPETGAFSVFWEEISSNPQAFDGTIIGTLTVDEFRRWARAAVHLTHANALRNAAQIFSQRGRVALEQLLLDVNDRLGTTPLPKTVLDPLSASIKSPRVSRPKMGEPLP